MCPMAFGNRRFHYDIGFELRSILSQACFLDCPRLAHPVSPQDEISLSEYGGAEGGAKYDCPDNCSFSKCHRENAESKVKGYIIVKSGRMLVLIGEFFPDRIQAQFAVENEQHQVVGHKSSTDPCPPVHRAKCNSTARTLMVIYASHVLAHSRKSASSRRNTIERAFHSQLSQDSKEPKPLWLEVSVVEHREPVSRGDAIKRALKSHENPLEDASMTRNPEHLRVLPKGAPFVHNFDPTLHIYYSSAAIQ
ncbi:unnamed protein product, partial [Cylicostephanus goldi]